ncbi:hypothetical protein VTK26DRAFT_2976 [Humicola hyalothermophila]
MRADNVGKCFPLVVSENSLCWRTCTLLPLSGGLTQPWLFAQLTAPFLGWWHFTTSTDADALIKLKAQHTLHIALRLGSGPEPSGRGQKEYTTVGGYIWHTHGGGLQSVALPSHIERHAEGSMGLEAERDCFWALEGKADRIINTPDQFPPTHSATITSTAY